MKKVILFLFAFIAVQSAFAQKEVLKNKEDSLRVGWWERKTQLGFNVSGAAFNKSWQGGGVNNLSLGTYFNNLSVFTKGKGVWTNDAQLQYGRLSNYYQDKTKESRKGVDRIFLESKYSRVVRKELNWFSSLNFLSQFDKGIDYAATTSIKPTISKFLYPGFLTLSSGLEWKIRPYMLVQLGLAGRTTFIGDDATIFANTAKLVKGESKSYGVVKGNTSLTELGFQPIIAFDKDIFKNINLKARYQGFWAMSPEFKALDSNINLIATAKINKYLNVNLTGIFIRDLDQVSKADLVKDATTGKSKYNSVWQSTGGFNLGFSLKL